MPIHPTLVQLLELAETDLALDKLDRLTAKLRAAVPAAKTHLADANKALEDARGAVSHNAREQARLQSQIESYERRRNTATRALEQGLGDADAAQRQLDQCSDLIDGFEMEQLEQMELEPAQAHAVRGATTALAQAEQALVDAKSTLKSELVRMAEERVVLGAKRSHIHGGLDREIRSRYDTRRKRKGTAVSSVVDGFCRACRLSPPRQELADLRRGLMLSCRGCGRWLVVRD